MARVCGSVHTFVYSQSGVTSLRNYFIHSLTSSWIFTGSSLSLGTSSRLGKTDFHFLISLDNTGGKIQTQHILVLQEVLFHLTLLKQVHIYTEKKIHNKIPRLSTKDNTSLCQIHHFHTDTCMNVCRSSPKKVKTKCHFKSLSGTTFFRYHRSA